MQAASVIQFWEQASKIGLTVCIDGGWAVDALLGAQTRPHGDLDIALPASQVPSLRALLGAQGFREVPRPDSWEHNFVLQSPDGDTINVHSYVLHPEGRNKAGVPYIADHLCGEGVILGVTVVCVPADWLVRFHTGYDVDDEDWHDVQLLCTKFNLAIPEIYERFLPTAPDG